MWLLALIAACGGEGPPAPGGAMPAPARLTAADAPCINEIMPDNEASVLDEAGEADDWIELFNPGAADLSLAGWTLSDDRDDPGKVALDPSLVIPAGGALLLWADDTPAQGPTHLPLQLSADGEEVGLYDPAGNGTVVAFGKVYADFAVARDGDCCPVDGCWVFDFRGTPGATNHPPVPVEETALALGSTWAYRDDGGPSDADWATAAYDDSAWARGAAPLGYGDAHIVTVVSYGEDAAAKPITTWFRTSFELASLDGVAEAELRLVRDDGARVFLNGVEIARSNLPEGTLVDDTRATLGVGSGDETAAWAIAFDPAALALGTNVLAVEVHQAAPDSSDLGFDLGVVLTRLVAVD